MKPSGIELQLVSKPNRRQDDHNIYTLEVTLINDTNQRINAYDLEVRLPAGILKHFSATYPAEVESNDRRYRRFRYSRSSPEGVVGPRERQLLISFDYCTVCAWPESGMIGALVVDEANVTATIWINGTPFTVEKTIRQLAMERELRSS